MLLILASNASLVTMSSQTEGLPGCPSSPEFLRAGDCVEHRTFGGVEPVGAIAHNMDTISSHSFIDHNRQGCYSRGVEVTVRGGVHIVRQHMAFEQRRCRRTHDGI